MIKYVAKVHGEAHALYNLKTNKVEIFEQDPKEFLSFLEGDVSLEDPVKFLDIKAFNDYIELYIKEEVNQESQKRAFNNIVNIIKQKGISKFDETIYTLTLSNRDIELVFWKNNVISLIDRSGSTFVRVDLDEKNKLGFYSLNAENHLFDLEDFLMSL